MRPTQHELRVLCIDNEYISALKDVGVGHEAGMAYMMCRRCGVVGVSLPALP